MIFIEYVDKYRNIENSKDKHFIIIRNILKILFYMQGPQLYRGKQLFSMSKNFFLTFKKFIKSNCIQWLFLKASLFIEPEPSPFSGKLISEVLINVYFYGLMEQSYITCNLLMKSQKVAVSKCKGRQSTKTIFIDSKRSSSS